MYFAFRHSITPVSRKHSRFRWLGQLIAFRSCEDRDCYVQRGSGFGTRSGYRQRLDAETVLRGFGPVFHSWDGRYYAGETPVYLVARYDRAGDLIWVSSTATDRLVTSPLLTRITV